LKEIFPTLARCGPPNSLQDRASGRRLPEATGHSSYSCPPPRCPAPCQRAVPGIIVTCPENPLKHRGLLVALSPFAPQKSGVFRSDSGGFRSIGRLRNSPGELPFRVGNPFFPDLRPFPPLGPPSFADVSNRGGVLFPTFLPPSHCRPLPPETFSCRGQAPAPTRLVLTLKQLGL